MQDSLTQIKFTEKKAKGDIGELKEQLQKERRQRENEWNEKIKRLKEEYAKKNNNIEKGVEEDFVSKQTSLLKKHKKKIEEIKESYDENLESFCKRLVDNLL